MSIRIHVRPGARAHAVVGLHGDALKVCIAAPALDGRANAALVEFLAERLGVARRDVRLVSGERSREKRLEVRGGADPARLLD